MSLLLLSVALRGITGLTLRETGVRQQREDAQGHIGDERSLLLDLNQPIKRKIGGGENHYYRIMLMSDEYLRLIVDQRGIDVSVSLYAPDGSIVAESNRFIRSTARNDPWVAEIPGFYKLQIRSDGRENNAEYYDSRSWKSAWPRFRTESYYPSEHFCEGGATSQTKHTAIFG